jgi:hypothetical protein
MVQTKEETKRTQPTDAERLEWCLKYGVVGTLGVVSDIEYIPLTLDLIDKAIAKAKGKE